MRDKQLRIYNLERLLRWRPHHYTDKQIKEIELEIKALSACEKDMLCEHCCKKCRRENYDNCEECLSEHMDILRND